MRRKPQSFYTVEHEQFKIYIEPQTPMAREYWLMWISPRIEEWLKCLWDGNAHMDDLVTLERYKWQASERLRYWRERRNYSQKELAERSGVHATRISRIESKQSQMGRKCALKLAQALDCHYLELL
ncbi:MAG: helix-turn-helix transcriptional regulator [Bdellovibrionales bacterium]|nr:helix-turn-helix transcriptional regulator [Bdellovibrionales bacterium]